RDYERVLRSYLHAAGVNRVDSILLSHGDSLHIGATESVLRDFAPSLLIDNPAADRSTVHLRLREVFSARGINVSNLAAGQTFEIAPHIPHNIVLPYRCFA